MKNKLLKISLSFVAVLLLFAVGIIVYLQLQFPSYLYQNGLGETFNVNFYRDATQQPTSELSIGELDLVDIKASDMLLSPPRNHFSTALVVSEQVEGSIFEEFYCQQTPTFSITMQQTGEEAAVCSPYNNVSLNNSPNLHSVWMTEFTAQGKRYKASVIRISDTSYFDPVKYPERAEEYLQNNEFSDGDVADIALILESITLD